MADASERFAFGENWSDFVDRSVDDGAIDAAVAGVARLLSTRDLSGKSFLDIGCGSGLSSLAALRMNAKTVTAFDYDPASVAAATKLRGVSKFDSDRWSIFQGSILDESLAERLPRADVVYSWGVLHHTGDMWKAIDIAAGLVKPGGLFAIAIYNEVTSLVGSSRMWWHLKRTYNRSPPALRRVAEYAYLARFAAAHAVRLRNPVTAFRSYSKGTSADRGMDPWHDIRDWLGGFPYEYSTAGKVFRHVRERFGFDLEYLDTQDGIGCNEFCFRRALT